MNASLNEFLLPNEFLSSNDTQQEHGKIEAFYWSQHSRQGALNLLKIDHRHIKENSGSKSDPGELTNRTLLSSWSRKLESNFVKSQEILKPKVYKQRTTLSPLHEMTNWY